MNSTEYIIEKVKTFVKLFPKVKVRYEFDKVAVVHTIEVTPRQIHNDDNDVLDWEMSLWDDFVELFPFENIMFCSDDDLVGIRNVDFEVEGIDFGRESSFNTNKNSISEFDYNISQTVANVPTILSVEYSNSNLYSYYSYPNAA